MNLYIIGNGFDLSHGLETSYEDFRVYLEREDKDYYEKITDLLPAKYSLWKDLEANLANVNPDNFDFLERIFGNENSPQSAMHFPIDILTKDLYSHLASWINCVMKSAKSKKIEKKYIFNENDIFLDFNYSSTLVDVYKISIYNDFRIHGNSVLSGEYNLSDCETVLGHKLNYYPVLDEIKHKEEYKVLCDATAKNTKAIIEADSTHFYQTLEENAKNISKVEVIGCSYSNIDLNYFIKVFEILGTEIVTILNTYNDKDKIGAEKYRDDLGLNNCKVM